MLTEIRARVIGIFLATFCLTAVIGACRPTIDVAQTASRAQTLLNKNEPKQSEAQLSQALKVLGTSDVNALERAPLLLMLGEACLGQDKFWQAESSYMECLSIYQRKFGIDSMEIVGPLEGLMQMYRKQKKYAAAEKKARRILSIQEKHFGQGDPRLEPVISNVLSVACAVGECQDAVDLYTRLVLLRIEKYGPHNFKTNAARLLLAESLVHHKNYEQAITLLKENVASYSILQPRELVVALNNLAHVMELSGDTKGAWSKIQEASDLEKRQMKKFSGQEVITTLRLSGRILADEGKFAQAAQAYADTVAEVTKTYGDNSPHLADCLSDYAFALAHAGRAREARSIQAQAERIYQKR